MHRFKPSTPSPQRRPDSFVNIEDYESDDDTLADSKSKNQFPSQLSQQIEQTKKKKKKKSSNSKREADGPDSDSDASLSQTQRKHNIAEMKNSSVSKSRSISPSDHDKHRKLMQCLRDIIDINKERQKPVIIKCVKHSNMSTSEPHDPHRKCRAYLQALINNMHNNNNNIFKTEKIAIDLSVDTDEDGIDIIMETNNDQDIPDAIMKLVEECKEKNKQKRKQMLQQQNEEKKLHSADLCYLSYTLSQADQVLIEKIFECEPEDVVSTHTRSNNLVRVKDLRTLGKGVWLNDEVVNGYVAILQDKNIQNVRDNKKNNCPRTLIMNSFFYTKLCNKNYNYKAMKRWTKTKDLRKKGLDKAITIFDFDKMICPMHVNNNHWSCGCINFKKQKFELYDSDSKNIENNSSIDFFRIIRQYFMDEWADKNNTNINCSLDGWTDDDNHAKYPQQNNCSDCGAFTLECIKSLCIDQYPDYYKQENIPYLRKKMTIEIICGEILDINDEP